LTSSVIVRQVIIPFPDTIIHPVVLQIMMFRMNLMKESRVCGSRFLSRPYRPRQLVRSEAREKTAETA
jgi:hypothetical protein